MAAVTGAVVVVTAGALWLGFTSKDAATSPGTSPVFTTTLVTTGDVVEESSQQGELAFSDAQPILTRRTGTVTALPVEAAVITPGATLFSVDAHPVVLLRGTFPAWRDFSIGMIDGDDVQQLEQNLNDIGVFNGDIDRTFTSATAAAVKNWQKNLGTEASGALAASSILFSPTDIRVSGLTVRIGAPVADGTEIFEGTATVKTVAVNLRLEDQQLAAVGGQVTIALPDNTEISGSVAAVGLPHEIPGDGTDGTAAVVVAVTITPTDQAATGEFARANVTVRFPSALHKDALTVPIDALIATGPHEFAVQVPGAAGTMTTVPVTLGVFQAGRVQITGEGITAGTKVIVP